MCGVVGILDLSGKAGDNVSPEVISALCEAMHHRGPDSDGNDVVSVQATEGALVRTFDPARVPRPRAAKGTSTCP